MSSGKDDPKEEKEQEVISVGEYKLPVIDPVEVEVPTDPNKPKIPFNKLSPLEKIRMAAAQNGIITLSAGKPSCKSCYGRGYVSQTVLKVPEGTSSTDDMTVDDEGKVRLPNPCKCIFYKKDLPKVFTGNVALSRVLRRRLEKRTEIKTSRDNVKKKILEDKDRLLSLKKKKKKQRKQKTKKKKLQRNK